MKTLRTLTSNFLTAALMRRRLVNDALNGHLAKGEASATRLRTRTLQRGIGTTGVQPKVYFNKSGQATVSAGGKKVENRPIQLNASGQGAGQRKEAKRQQ